MIHWTRWRLSNRQHCRAGRRAVPTGWLLCDGAPYSRATYAALFGVIDTTFGIGNGSTTLTSPICAVAR